MFVAATAARGNDACPSTPAKVVDQCGCHPVDERAFNQLQISHVTPEMDTTVKNCLTAGAQGEVLSKKAGASLYGCIEKATTLAPDYKLFLLSLLKPSVTYFESKAGQSEISAFNICRQKALGSSRVPTAVAAKTKARRSKVWLIAQTFQNDTEIKADDVFVEDGADLQVAGGKKLVINAGRLFLPKTGKATVRGIVSAGSPGGSPNPPPDWDNRGTNCNHSDWAIGHNSSDRGADGGVGGQGGQGPSIVIGYKELAAGSFDHLSIDTSGGPGGPGGKGALGRRRVCCHCGQSDRGDSGNDGLPGPVGPAGEKKIYKI
ncbi:MAG: hypothetical protein JST92_17720 [Deltaproteobacteria bacterium]|nr:hypothetical protein [Deltaproteobacteria bacterium]